MPTARSQLTSLIVHAVTIAFLLFFTTHSIFTVTVPMDKPQTQQHILLAPPPKFIRVATADKGGGSNTSSEPARRGNPPPRANRIFIPPTLHENPLIPIPVTIDYDVPAVTIASNDIGNPLSKFGGKGTGKNGGGGLGDLPGGGPGIGDEGPGTPGFRGRIGTPTKPAQLIYRVDPEFSEDARKAKFQGIVVLMIEIGVDGKPHNPRIVQTPGLGLDAKAIEAVTQWRFRPALHGSTPVISTARVEVYFHLL